ncbi:MAG: DUF1802 family protein [Nitrososphaerales archaeon]
MQTLKEWQALKEWAVVVKALEENEQCILFRKGGILDPAFSVESSEFLLFPTFEHQTKEYLKDHYKNKFDELLSKRSVNKVTITSAAKVVTARETSDKEKLHRLKKYHVYDDDFIDYRMQWNQDKPISILFVRVYYLEDPLTINILPEYAGCRSWIKISASTSFGRPVLNDKEFNELKEEIEALIS